MHVLDDAEQVTLRPDLSWWLMGAESSSVTPSTNASRQKASSIQICTNYSLTPPPDSPLDS
jgi:hypothetical protein